MRGPVDEAARFLSTIDPDATEFTFQTFADVKDGKSSGLVQVLHGSLDRHRATLHQLNDRDAGIFVTINETDFAGRKGTNIVRVRAVFVDLDGAPLEPVLDTMPEPHCVTETSPGRWHVFWRVSDCPLDAFTPIQQALAVQFGGDTSVKDLPRVMRLPGFSHRKNAPFLSRIVSTSHAAPYNVADIEAEIEIKPAAQTTKTPAIVVAPTDRTSGITRREWGRINSAAMANLDAWVPKLFPRAEKKADGNWRVTSKSLGRNLEEDLSITSKGIMDFGLHDVGDLRHGKRTPIEVVRAWSHLAGLNVGPEEWLRARLGMEEAAAESEERGADYELHERGLYWQKPVKSGVVPVRLSNFTAVVVEDVKFDDGSGTVDRRFVVEGSLGRAEVPAEKFDGMTWVTREWGARAIITPGPYHMAHIANAMKALAGEIKQETVFTHLGWRSIDGRWVYLHGGGAIGADNVRVKVSDTLAQFVLPPVTDIKTAIRASLSLLDVAPACIAYPLWGAIYRTPLSQFAPMTVSVWLTGPSGTLKTAVALMAQAHFAPTISARSAANWTSTANANERLAFLAKDALLLIDDFAPRGTVQEMAKLHAAAERLIRAAANRSGRARMNADATLKPEMYPRGGLLGTGEDVPNGQSLRARMIVVEVRPGDVNPEKLQAIQRAPELLGEAMAGYVSWLAAQDKAVFARRERELRARGTGLHARTPENIAVIQLGVETGLRFAVEVGALTASDAAAKGEAAWATLLELADAQEQFLRSENPAHRFIGLIREVLSSGRAHVTTPGGDEPWNKLALGWREVAWKGGGETGGPPEPVYRGQGRKIGVVDEKKGLLYLTPEVTFSEAQALARDQNSPLPVTQNTLWKRLDDAGYIAVKDSDGRVATKVRTEEGRPRVIAFRLTTIIARDEEQAQEESDGRDEEQVQEESDLF